MGWSWDRGGMGSSLIPFQPKPLQDDPIHTLVPSPKGHKQKVFKNGNVLQNPALIHTLGALQPGVTNSRTCLQLLLGWVTLDKAPKVSEAKGGEN